MRGMTDVKSDALLFVALFTWILCCIHPALGMIVQYPLIILLVTKCNIKAIPALLILVLGRGNLRIFGDDSIIVLRLGITLSPDSMFVISTFFFAIYNIIRQKYDSSTSAFGYLWLLSAIPAAAISFTAKSYGVSGIWSGPIMDFLIPSVYFWGISMAYSYEEGRDYLAKRLAIILLFCCALQTINVFFVLTFYTMSLAICLSFYVLGEPRFRNWRFICMLGLFAALAQMTFGRRIAIADAIAMYGIRANELDTEQMGSTFTRMSVCASAVLLCVAIRRLLARSLIRIIPVVMFAVNILLVSFVISRQSGNKAIDTQAIYTNMEERFNYKLFGDRAAVWAMGWEEVKSSPYFFKDLRKFVVYDRKRGDCMKLPPHNQFLTLIGREGWWLGLTLSLFIVWVWVRAFDTYSRMRPDNFFAKVFLPVGSAVYFAVGIAGQSVVSPNLWCNSLVALVFPGIIYGYWQREREYREI